MCVCVVYVCVCVGGVLVVVCEVCVCVGGGGVVLAGPQKRECNKYESVG